MQECRDESEIYNYQRIQLLNNEFINGILGVRLTWLDCNNKSTSVPRKFSTFVVTRIIVSLLIIGYS